MDNIEPEGTNGRPRDIVCVIDDDADVRWSICQALQRAGFSTINAPGGEAGVEAVQDSGACVAIVDILMAGFDGFETLAALKVRCPNTRVLALSGGGAVGPESYLDFARMLGAHDAIEKPFRIADLVEKVTALASSAKHGAG